jgi:hypothetical protein
MKIQVNGSPEKFVSRMFYLAYQSSEVFGMGFLQAQDDVTEEQVMENITNHGDYPYRGDSSGLDADYVFGRMMKLYAAIKDDIISFDHNWRTDYQSFCRSYTPTSLCDKVAEQLGITYTIVE